MNQAEQGGVPQHQHFFKASYQMGHLGGGLFYYSLFSAIILS